jgi:hypothetical protein
MASTGNKVMATKIPLGVRVEPEIKEAITQAANKDRRKLTAQVEMILAEWLDAKKKKAK